VISTNSSLVAVFSAVILERVQPHDFQEQEEEDFYLGLVPLMLRRLHENMSYSEHIVAVVLLARRYAYSEDLCTCAQYTFDTMLH